MFAAKAHRANSGWALALLLLVHAHTPLQGSETSDLSAMGCAEDVYSAFEPLAGPPDFAVWSEAGRARITQARLIVPPSYRPSATCSTRAAACSVTLYRVEDMTDAARDSSYSSSEDEMQRGVGLRFSIEDMIMGKRAGAAVVQSGGLVIATCVFQECFVWLPLPTGFESVEITMFLVGHLPRGRYTHCVERVGIPSSWRSVTLVLRPSAPFDEHPLGGWHERRDSQDASWPRTSLPSAPSLLLAERDEESGAVFLSRRIREGLTKGWHSMQICSLEPEHCTQNAVCRSTTDWHASCCMIAPCHEEGMERSGAGGAAEAAKVAEAEAEAAKEDLWKETLEQLEQADLRVYSGEDEGDAVEGESTAAQHAFFCDVLSQIRVQLAGDAAAAGAGAGSGQEDLVRVLEVGFNRGVGARGLLACGEYVAVTSFDLRVHGYEFRWWTHARKMYPGRISVVLGPSQQTIAAFAWHNPRTWFHFFFVDGAHSEGAAYLDLRQSCAVAAPGAWVVVDDVAPWVHWGRGAAAALARAGEEGWLHLEMLYGLDHRACRISSASGAGPGGREEGMGGQGTGETETFGGGFRELKDVRLEELREVAMREGWTHECKVWALGRFALDEHDVDVRFR